MKFKIAPRPSNRVTELVEENIRMAEKLKAYSKPKGKSSLPLFFAVFFGLHGGLLFGYFVRGSISGLIVISLIACLVKTRLASKLKLNLLLNALILVNLHAIVLFILL